MASLLETLVSLVGVFLDWISENLRILWQSISNLLAWVFDFLSNGLYDFLVWAYAGLVEYLTIAYIKSEIWAIRFGWDVAKQIIVDLHFQDLVNSAFASLPPDVLYLLSVLRFSEVVGFLSSAFVTKFVLKFVPRIGV